MKRTYILSSIVVAIALVLAVSEVRAADFPTVPQTLCRECELNGEVRIVAGPDASGEPTAEFPRVVKCPDPVDCPDSNLWDPPLIGQYLLWLFQFTYTGINPSLSYLTVASDIEIAQSYAPAHVYGPGEGDAQSGLGENVWECLTFRYTANDTTYRAGYYTELGIAPRIATAGYKSGRHSGYCLLAGAGTEVLDPGQAQADSESFVLPGTGCTVEYNVAHNGKVVLGSMRVVEGDCEIEETIVPVEIDGRPTEYVGRVQWMTAGTCRYCWVNTYGGQTCCRCTGCCIKKGTNKCIPKPADLSKCKASSLP